MISLRKFATLTVFVAVAPVITAANAAANVSWDFILTAATDPICLSCPPPVPLPDIGVRLTVSNAAFFRGSVSYTYFITSDQFDNRILDAVGDTDFNLEIGAFSLPIAPMFIPIVEFGGVGLGISRDGALSGRIFDNVNFQNLQMEIENSVVTNALWSSDDGPITLVLDGYWQLTSELPLQVPEPSSAVILLGAIAAARLLRPVTARPPS